MRFDNAVRHPAFCSGQGCSDPATGDIVHRGPRHTSVTPASDRDRPLAFELLQADECAGGRQVEHEPEIALHIGADTLVLSLEEFASMLRDAGHTLTRGRQCLRGYPSSA